MKKKSRKKTDDRLSRTVQAVSKRLERKPKNVSEQVERICDVLGLNPDSLMRLTIEKRAGYVFTSSLEPKDSFWCLEVKTKSQ